MDLEASSVVKHQPASPSTNRSERIRDPSEKANSAQAKYCNRAPEKSSQRACAHSGRAGELYVHIKSQIEINYCFLLGFFCTLFFSSYTKETFRIKSAATLWSCDSQSRFRKPVKTVLTSVVSLNQNGAGNAKRSLVEASDHEVYAASDSIRVKPGVTGIRNTFLEKAKAQRLITVRQGQRDIRPGFR